MFKCVKITSFFALLFELLPDTTITVSGDFDFLRSWVNYKYRKKQKNKTKYFHENHNLSDHLNVTILENNIKTAAARRYHEDKWICKLKTLAPNGLNTEIGDYAKEMYNFY